VWSPKKGSVGYDTSKAAANHLVRELAVELSPLVRVNGLAPATVVEGSSMFPRDRVIGSLVKYNIAHDAEESTEVLRSKLANFYARRTLTKRPINPRRSSRSGISPQYRGVQQNYWTNLQCRRWSARGVPALGNYLGRGAFTPLPSRVIGVALARSVATLVRLRRG
jgi:hypothetical protein